MRTRAVPAPPACLVGIALDPLLYSGLQSIAHTASQRAIAPTATDLQFALENDRARTHLPPAASQSASAGLPLRVACWAPGALAKARRCYRCCWRSRPRPAAPTPASFDCLQAMPHRYHSVQSMAVAPDIPTLVLRLQIGSRVAQLRAASALSWLIRAAGQLGAQAQAEFAAAGGIQAAVQLLRSNTSAIRHEATMLHGRACYKNEASVAVLVAAGGIRALVSALKGSGTNSDEQLWAPAAALTNAMEVSAAAVHAAVAACGAKQLSALLHQLLQRRVQGPPAW